LRAFWHWNVQRKRQNVIAIVDCIWLINCAMRIYEQDLLVWRSFVKIQVNSMQDPHVTDTLAQRNFIILAEIY